jgi:hypothetical protein
MISNFARTQDRVSTDPQGKERRASPRRLASELPFLKSVKLLAGPDVRLVDVSRGGALLESDTPLPPGTRICLRLVTTDTTILIDGRVLRSRVSCLQAGLVRYKSAIAFDEDVALFAEDRQEEAAAAPASAPPLEAAAPSSSTPEAKAAGNASPEHSAAYMTVTAVVQDSGPDLHQIFGTNDW